MADHHRTMRQILQVQERLMLAYLEGGERMPRPFSTPRAAPASRLPASRPVTPQPPAAARTVERPAVPSLATPVPPPPAPAPARRAAPLVPQQAPMPSPALQTDPKALLLKIASERTGYPEDMLGLDLDMEADLGIDSIKRVEILAAFRKAQPAAVSDFSCRRWRRSPKRRPCRKCSIASAPPFRRRKEPLRPFDQSGEGHGAALFPVCHAAGGRGPA